MDQNPRYLCFNAKVIGQVLLETNCSVWFGAVIRADEDAISIARGTNIQDNAVIHVDRGYPVVIGEKCIIGHRAVVHGATLEHHVLIGIGATVMNGAHIGAYSIIGAHALVTSNMIIPPNSLVLGSPAKIKGSIDEEGMLGIDKSALDYIERAQVYLSQD